MSAWRLLGQVLLVGIYGAPWGWIAAFGALVWATISETGHFPSYSNPDPKSLADYGWLYEVNAFLLVLAFVSPVLVALHVAFRAVWYPVQPLQRRRLVFYAIGAAIVAAVVFGNPAGLSSWFFD
jgi:hypothetical protein